MSTQNYSPIAGNNRAINGINVKEGCSPGTVNDAIRNLMADIASDIVGTLASGRLGYTTYALLTANTTAVEGTLAEVPITDTGTHLDPVAGGIVNNAGVFRKEALEWRRLYDGEAAAADIAADRAEAASAAITASIAGAPAGTALVLPAATRGVMSAMPTTMAAVLLYEAGREGVFVWSPLDQSVNVTADPAQGVYVPPASALTGAAGAWVRAGTVLTPFMFGAIGDGVTNDLTALQRFNDYVFADERLERCDFTGEFAISGQLIIGRAVFQADHLDRRRNVGGDLRLRQLVATFESVRVRYLNQVNWQGGIGVQGIGDRTFASRTCGVGIAFQSCGGGSFDWVYARFFWFAGVITPEVVASDLNIGLHIGSADIEFCGSGRESSTGGVAGDGLTSVWSLPVNSGDSGGPAQRTQLSMSVLPVAEIETYELVGNQQLHVLINGYPYFVYEINRVAGTISVFPWIDSTIGTGGIAEWVIGAGLMTLTNDSGILNIDYLNVKRCGKALGVAGLYGPRIGSGNLSYGGIGAMFGRIPSSAHLGTSLDGIYTEGNVLDYCFNGNIEGDTALTISSTTEINLAKVLQIGNQAARTSANLLERTTWGARPYGGGMFVAEGRFHAFHDDNIGATAAATRPFRDHVRPPRIVTQVRDSQTVPLLVQGTGEYNRLFGYRGARYCYSGTGPNNAPTGTFTFEPPTGGTVNGGAVNISAAFTGFSGPADFEIFHTDTAQLTWVARPVSGWRRSGSKTYDPPSVASLGTATTTVTVAGAALGDQFVASFSLSLGGLMLTAYVSAADTVTTVLFNPTAAAVDLASGTLTVRHIL